MSILLDARPLANAVKAAVSANLGGSTAYDRDDVPGSTFGPTGTLPGIYALVDVERRFEPSTRRVGSSSGTTSWRVTVGAAGSTVDECRWAIAKATAAIEEQPLALTGVGATGLDSASTVLTFETERAPERDDEGRYYASASFTCAI